MSQAPAQTAAAPQKTRCPCRGCEANPYEGKLMCLKHWQMVPRQTQHCVWAAYSSLRKHPTRENLLTYQQVRQRAIDAVDRQGPLSP